MRVRQAIAYAIDRQALVDKVLLGRASVANSPMPPGTYGQVDAPAAYPHDPEKAKQLLADAGHPDGLPIRFSVFAGIRVLGEEICQAIVQMLGEAGIKADLDIQEPGVAVKDALAPKPVHHHVPPRVRLEQRRAAAVHARQHAQPRPVHRQGPRRRDRGDERDGGRPRAPELLKQIQATFMERLPHLPLYHLQLTDVTSAKVHGYVNPTDGYSPRFWRTFLA